MQITISGETRRCFTSVLGTGVRAFAVCDGFGSIGGMRVEEAALASLRDVLAARARSPRFAFQLERPKAMSSLLVSVVSRVNSELYARSASHDDYVTAGASLTLVVLCADRAYLAHMGNTAAYLSRGGYMISLTKDDSWLFDAPAGRAVAVSAHPPVLTRALGIAPTIELSVCSFRVSSDDSLVLSNRRLSGFEDRRALSAWILHGAQPFDLLDRTVAVVPIAWPEETAGSQARTLRGRLGPILAGVAAALTFFCLL